MKPKPTGPYRLSPAMCILILAAAMILAAPATGEDRRVPVIHYTDLYHPHVDADDHIDLATVFALPELDLKAILLDNGLLQRKSPGRIPVEQMLAITGRRVPYAPGLAPLKSPGDAGRDQPAEFQQAVELLLKTLRESDRPIRIIATGSVRDLTAAFNREPDLMRAKVAGLYVNIGNSSIGGVEYNVELDRHAWRGLVGSGLPIFWFPCFPKDVRETAYWRLTGLPETLGGVPAPLRNFFLYAVRRLDPARYEPQASLAADLGPIGAAFKDAGAFRAGKEMWSTASILEVAGRRLYRISNLKPAAASPPPAAGGEATWPAPYRYVAAASPPPGAVEVRAWEFVPARLEVDEQGKPTRIDSRSSAPNVRVIRLTDARLYSDAMNGCLKDLLIHFPVAAKAGAM